MDKTFDILPIKKELLSTLQELKFYTMTPVQEKSIPLILEGKDVIAQAKTGSGKTAAFGLGILNSLDVSINDIHSLVLCPTRELAEQVATDLRTLARSLQNIKIITLCGGAPESLQRKSLEQGAHIIVGTPGRVLHHLDKGSLRVEALNFFTLDEADRMLDMGFSAEIMEVVGYLPRSRQSLLFSATYPENIQKLSKDVQKNAVEVKVDVTHESENIEQTFYEIKDGQDKNNFLYKILSHYKPDRSIIFCKTKKDTNDIENFLINRDIFAQCLNGDLDQSERTEVFTKFSNQSLSILVATDVAARGLDIEKLPMILNYSLPASAEDYIHRIGRTGRAGQKGRAFSFFDTFETFRLKEIEILTKKPCLIEDVSQLTYTQKYNLVPPMETMYITGGRKHKIRRGDILGALVGEAKLDAKDVGDISVFNDYSFVAIKSKHINKAIEKLNAGKIKKKKYRVGKA